MARYADFTAELETASGLPPGCAGRPPCRSAYNADDAARLTVCADFLAGSALGRPG